MLKKVSTTLPLRRVGWQGLRSLVAVGDSALATVNTESKSVVRLNTNSVQSGTHPDDFANSANDL